MHDKWALKKISHDLMTKPLSPECRRIATDNLFIRQAAIMNLGLHWDPFVGSGELQNKRYRQHLAAEIRRLRND